LAFGITFEVPVVVVVLVHMKIVPLAKLKEIRPYVIVGAFVISAVVTPPDVLSQLLLAVPMTVLYELGLLVARLYVPKPSTEDETSDPQANSASS
jgi:sec-independent protein translocase protein TatC